MLGNKTHCTDGWVAFNSKNVYYYKYNNYEILINSELDLIFKSDKNEMQTMLHLTLKDDTKDYSQYNIWTRYFMWNKYIKEVRYKDLIWPVWTGRDDEF